MILVKKNDKICHLRHIWPIYYRTTSLFLKGNPICLTPSNIPSRMPRIPIHRDCRCLFLPAPTASVPTSTVSMSETSPLLNGWAKTRPSGGCIVKPAVPVSANGKVRSWNIQSYRKSMWSAFSNVWAMAVRWKPRRTSATWILAPCSGSWRTPVNVPTISTACNWKSWRIPSRRSRWMSCTAKPSKPNGTVCWWRFPKSCVNASVKKGQNVASYGSGRKKSFSARFDHWSPNPRYSVGIDGLGRCLFQRQGPTPDFDRRSFAISAGHSYGIWKNPPSPPQKRPRPVQGSPAQTAGKFAGGRCQETARRPGAFAESFEQGIVWQKENHREAYSRAGDWSNDQHLSCGTTQRHHPRSASPADPTNARRFSSGKDAAVFDLAVERFDQLDTRSLCIAGRNAGDGYRAGRRGVDGVEVYFVSGSCQRPSACRLGRTA